MEEYEAENKEEEEEEGEACAELSRTALQSCELRRTLGSVNQGWNVVGCLVGYIYISINFAQIVVKSAIFVTSFPVIRVT